VSRASESIIVDQIVQLMDRTEPVPHLGEKTELSECGLDSLSY
jgi:hypothetical protein